MTDNQPSGDNPPRPQGGKPCPVCGKPSVDATKPFCSTRCQDVDLNRWLSGGYAIPGKSVEDDPDA